MTDSPEVIHLVIHEDGTLETHVNATGNLSRIYPADLAWRIQRDLTAVKKKLS